MTLITSSPTSPTPSDSSSVASLAVPLTVSPSARQRFVPLIRNVWLRTAIGLVVLLASVMSQSPSPTDVSLPFVFVMMLAWSMSLWMTQKYVHKYPQRYLPYLIASHVRAAIVMFAAIGVMAVAQSAMGVAIVIPWAAAAMFSIVDFLLSVPARKESSLPRSADELIREWKTEGGRPFAGISGIDRAAVLDELRAAGADKAVCDLVDSQLPPCAGTSRGVCVVGAVTESDASAGRSALIVGCPRMNDVRHLQRYLAYCAAHLIEGGFVVVRYQPLERVLQGFERHAGVRYWATYVCHFLWFRAVPKIPGLAALYFRPAILSLDTLYVSVAGRRNRALARAEMWGRLAYWGLDVVAECETAEDDVLVLAQAVRDPALHRTPSYMAVVGFEKVGLGGEPLRVHKVRTMFPFSEFLQKRIFEENGLAPNGKFANDFRLTEVGRWLRRYWIDEIPQLWDWLRGDIKLVGMRATSRHFLSLYPPEFIELYLQIKPGLIPPVFDGSVNTLDQIIAVEQRYLEQYWRKPLWTDVQYLFTTVRDIALRGVRSK